MVSTVSVWSIVLILDFAQVKSKSPFSFAGFQICFQGRVSTRNLACIAGGIREQVSHIPWWEFMSGEAVNEI